MKLQDRDIEIINYIEQYGATIQQAADLYFNGSYESANKRLRKLEQAKFIKGKLHPVLNKKVYYKRKIPSYHSLAIQDVYIKNRNIIQTYKREAKLENYKVDALIITKRNNVVILEVDIYNKTKQEKIDAVKQYVKTRLHCLPYIMILNKYDLQRGEAKRLPTE
ncbi:MAG: hypothetical protein ABFC57_18545 [Veillonellales bacterium]